MPSAQFTMHAADISVNRSKPVVPTGFRTHLATSSVGIGGCFGGDNMAGM